MKTSSLALDFYSAMAWVIAQENFIADLPLLLLDCTMNDATKHHIRM